MSSFTQCCFTQCCFNPVCLCCGNQNVVTTAKTYRIKTTLSKWWQYIFIYMFIFFYFFCGGGGELSLLDKVVNIKIPKKSSKKVNSLFLDYFDSCRQNACLSLPDSFSLCSALVSFPCVFCLIDRPTGVEMFYPSLSLPSSSISHPITLWDTCEGCGWKVNERDRELRRSREHRRREGEISFALAKNSAVQWTKEVCCGDGSSETVWNVLFIFFSSNNVSSSEDVLSLCGVLLDSSADSYRT